MRKIGALVALPQGFFRFQTATIIDGGNLRSPSDVMNGYLIRNLIMSVASTIIIETNKNLVGTLTLTRGGECALQKCNANSIKLNIIRNNWNHGRSLVMQFDGTIRAN
jgi:hypothetical protein